MSIKPLALLLIVLIFSSCNNSNSTNDIDLIITKFPLEISLEAEKYIIHSKPVKISRFNILDSLLVIHQNIANPLFSIYELKTLKHIKSFGSKGNGPNEFNMALPNTFKPIYGDELAFGMGNRLTKVQFYKIYDILNDDFSPYKTISLNPKLNRFRAISYLGDSLIFGAPYSQENIDIFKFDIKSNFLNTYVTYPNEFPLLSPEDKRNVYGSYLATKPDNTKFVRTYNNQASVEIYKTKDNKPFTIDYKNFPALHENLKINRSSKSSSSSIEQKIFSWGVKANDKYIYVFVINDFYYNISDNKGFKESLRPEVHVFDWKGGPIAKLKFDNGFINFDIDKEGRYLYASSEFEGNTILKYDLKKAGL